ncbi:hypothetical protein M0R45_009491 [Rubus argutus]|uniref:Tubby C-terminal domain-containing protein n=1 Tax=Rubus argutus TaxID=59490 RepID=A0AAW1Y692_RUBAR
MSFRIIVRDVRDGFGSLSRRNCEVRLTGHHRGKSHGLVHEQHDQPPVIQNSRWASLPPELLRDVIKWLEASESTWLARKHVVACAAQLRDAASLKQPGSWDGTIQCLKRDKSNLTYHLYLCLSPALLSVFSMDADNISRSSNTCIGKLRSNFLGTKFIIYVTQPPIPPYNNAQLSPPGRSHRFNSSKVSPKVPTCSYNIAQVTYELNELGTRGPRRMQSIPVSSLEPCGSVPGQPELLQRSLEDSFRNISFSKSIDNSTEFSSSRFSDIVGVSSRYEEEGKERPLVLRNKAPRWHEQLQCWRLNFRGRVTVASVKNFLFIAATTQSAAGAPAIATPRSQPHRTMTRSYFSLAFAICLSSFDTKLACE